MKKLFFLIFFAVTSLYIHSHIVCAAQTINSQNLTLEDVEPAILSGSLGGIHTQSAVIDISEIDLNSIKIIALHQERNTVFIYCNFTHKQGKKIFGYIPLLQINSTMWVNRDNGMIFEK